MGELLVLGGTAWLGREVARAALERGHRVTCLARGEAGAVAPGAVLVTADRAQPGAYDAVLGRDWDAVVDVSWQPAQVSEAVIAVGPRAAHWTYVSSCSVYAAHDTPGADEDAPLLAALADDVPATGDTYGEAKVACEAAVTSRVGDRALLARAGLIGGPGDASDRYGYWVSRFALAGDGAVLVPDADDQPTQTVDVRDLAAWLVCAGEAGTTGPVNCVGERQRLGDLLSAAHTVAGGRARRVAASAQWLQDNDVTGWAGPRSLPLWLPWADHGGFGARADARALRSGLTRRPVDQTLADTLADERRRGLGRERAAGLGRDDELSLLAALQH